MVSLLLAAACALGSVSPFPWSFVKVVGGPGSDRGVHVSRTQDGGYVAVGVTASFGAGGDDVYLVRTNAQGGVLWTKSYGGAGDDAGWAVHETGDGFIVAGFTDSFGAGGVDFYLIKTSTRGDLEWSRTYGGPADDFCWALTPTPDGGFLLAGETASFGAGQEDVYLVKTDGEGSELWSKTHGGAQGDRCFSVAPIEEPDGGYMLAGQTYSFGAGDRDVYVIKADANGDERWSRTFGGALSDVGHGITSTADGHFLVTGYTASFAAAGDDPYLVKIDTGGTPLWRRVLPLAGSNRTLTGEQAADHGFYLTGFSDYPGPGGKVALLVKTAPDGSFEWFQDVLRTPNGESFGYTIRATPDGGCVFAGHTTVGSAGGFDLLLVKARTP